MTNATANNSKKVVRGVIVTLAALGLLVLVLSLTGCSTTPESSVSSATPPSEGLVEQTAWAWAAGQPEEKCTDRDEFFAEPPSHVVLLNLQEQVEKYGYDFETLPAKAWELIGNVDHTGE